jgi:hypothetical protein
VGYYIIYNPALNNALVGLTETAPDHIPEGMQVKGRPGDFPDLARKSYNPAILDFYDKPNLAITKLKFIKKFTAAEYAAIKSAATANATLDYYWQMLMLAEEVRLDDPDTISGVQMLEQVGLLATGRAAEILG